MEKIDSIAICIGALLAFALRLLAAEKRGQQNNMLALCNDCAMGNNLQSTERHWEEENRRITAARDREQN